MYERCTIGLRNNLLTGRVGINIVTGVVVPRVSRRIHRVRRVVTTFRGSLIQGPLIRTPGDLLASSIATMRHVVLIAHGNFLALVASQFQATTDVRCDQTFEATLV